MKNRKTFKILVCALSGVILAAGMAPVCADENAELKKQVEVLSNRVAQLERELEQQRKSTVPTVPFFGSNEAREEMERLQSEVNRLFQESLGRGVGASLSPASGMAAVFDPQLDVQATKTQYVYKITLPGMTKDKIKVEVKDHLLTVSGEQSVATENTEGNVVRQARRLGSFVKTVSLPADANTNDLNTEYLEGILTIKLGRLSGGKAPETRTPKGK